MALSFASATANSMLAVISTNIDAGATAGLIRIHGGTMPANADVAITSEPLLAELICSDPSGSVATKALTLSAITQDASANASGTASFFRLLDSNLNVILQGDVTATGNGGALQLNTIAIVAGGPVQITSATFTLA